MNRLKGAVILFALALVADVTTAQRQHVGLDVNELLTLEPAVVPDPVDGSRWYYTPSRKAHMYRHNYPSAASITGKQTKQGEDMRLSGDLRPSLYDVRLLPFIEVGNFTTDGFVEITFNCIRATSNISINALQLTIDRASISIIDTFTSTPVSVVNYIDEQSTREMITVQTGNPLTVGRQYKISIKFTSILNAILRGFYRSSYVEDGITKYLAVTQFEETDARRAFPCFDEPEMKARYTVTLGRKSTWLSASNMPIIRTEAIPGAPGYVWDFYETSVTMSSYLVAFMVSEFIPIAAAPGLSKAQFRIWARAEASNKTGYAIDVGPRILDFFEGFYGIGYPLPKQDMAAIPDFAAGAMENWGLITYREEYLLIDTTFNAATAYALQLVAVVSAHELAHQWFGDLVTMQWWNEIWLNEGFASYMEYVGTNAVEPGFRMNEQFILENLQYVMIQDSLESSRPINIEVNTPAEISSLFDAISYEKGSCIIRMCADIIGYDTFVRGLNRYLNAHSYGNANQEDLWTALGQQATLEGVVLPTTLNVIMNPWTYKMGYPYITITRNYQTGAATATQQRFLSRKGNDTTDTTIYQWWVPLTYTSDLSRPKSKAWISENDVSQTIANVGATANQWVIFNVNQENYYRVLYDVTNYALIRDQLIIDHTRMSDYNRAQLLDDTFNLALANLVPYTQAMDLTLYLKNEREYVPWNAVLDELNYMDTMLYNLPEFTNWKRYMTSIVTPYYNYIGYQELFSDSHFTIFSRIDALGWACKLQVADCVQNAKSQYATVMQTPSSISRVISINEKNSVLRTAIENGGQVEWDFAFQQYQINGDRPYLYAMCRSLDPTVLSALLEKLLDANSGILRSDANVVFNYVANNPVGNEIALDFLINRWNDIQNALTSTVFPGWYRYVCTRQNTVAGYNKLVKLRDDHSVILGNSNTVQQGLDVVLQNIDWVSRHQSELNTWLANH